MSYRNIDQKPNSDDFAKARELIEIRGTGELSLQGPRITNAHYANAGQQLRSCQLSNARSERRFLGLIV